MIKPASLSTPPPHPSCTKILVRTALFAFLSSSPHPPPPLRYIQALDCFPAWLSSGWRVVQHHNQHFLTILRTFYPNTVPPPGVHWSSREKVKGVCRGGRLNTTDCQGFDLSPAPSAICPPHSFPHRNGNSFVSLSKKTGVKWGGNLKPCSSLTFRGVPAKFFQSGEGRPPSELP